MDEYVVVFEGDEEEDRGLCDYEIHSFPRATDVKNGLLGMFPAAEYNIYKLTRVEE